MIFFDFRLILLDCITFVKWKSSRVVASLSLLGGQDKNISLLFLIFPHFPVHRFSKFSSNFHFMDSFLVFLVGNLPTLDDLGCDIVILRGWDEFLNFRDMLMCFGSDGCNWDCSDMNTASLHFSHYIFGHVFSYRWIIESYTPVQPSTKLFTVKLA